MKRNLIGIALIVGLTGGAAAAGLALIEAHTASVVDTTPDISHFIRQTPEAWHPPMLPRPVPSIIPTPVPVTP